MTLTTQLERLGLALPAGGAAYGVYVPARRSGALIFVSGQLPMKDGRLLASGPVPSRCPLEQAQEAARQCVLNALGAVRDLEGTLAALQGVVRMGVFVQCDDGFADQPKVANAASELLLQLFGDPGRHARAAVGVSALPLNASVEIEFLFEARI